MDRATKEKSVEDIRETFDGVMSVVLADYSGVDVPTVTTMRDEFREAGCGYKVLKNSLVKLAIKDSQLEPMSVYLTGPTAIIWSHDSPSAPAKLAVKWAKESKAFEIKGGFFDGSVLDIAAVNQLSAMPDKPELQATLLMTFIAAPTELVKLMVAGPQNFAYLLDARKRQLEATQ